MRTIVMLLTAILSTATAPATGFVNFANSSSTLISANGAPMQPSSAKEYVFAVFLPPSTTVSAPGQTLSFADPAFQLASGYTTNHSTVTGRLITRNLLDLGSIAGYEAGATVDFVVRGWSSNMG